MHDLDQILKNIADLGWTHWKAKWQGSKALVTRFQETMFSVVRKKVLAVKYVSDAKSSFGEYCEGHCTVVIEYLKRKHFNAHQLTLPNRAFFQWRPPSPSSEICKTFFFLRMKLPAYQQETYIDDCLLPAAIAGIYHSENPWLLYARVCNFRRADFIYLWNGFWYLIITFWCWFVDSRFSLPLSLQMNQSLMIKWSSGKIPFSQDHHDGPAQGYRSWAVLWLTFMLLCNPISHDHSVNAELKYVWSNAVAPS